MTPPSGFPDPDESELDSRLADRPASGGQRPADSAADPAFSESPAGEDADGGPSASGAPENNSVEGEADLESEPGHRSPPQAGRDPETGPDAASPEPDLISALERERDDYRDALVRLQADFENYKKRVAKQQSELADRAAEVLVDKLLPVLDTADLALAHGGGEDVKQIVSSLYSALEREGLERIDLVGPFDPTLHDAVAHEPAEEGEEQEVVEVLRAGYRWKGRVLRPAMVKVRG